MVLGFILTFYNAVLFIWFIACSIVWIAEHDGEISCYFVPSILLIISFASCLVSLVVYNNFLLSPC